LGCNRIHRKQQTTQEEKEKEKEKEEKKEGTQLELEQHTAEEYKNLRQSLLFDSSPVKVVPRLAPQELEEHSPVNTARANNVYI